MLLNLLPTNITILLWSFFLFHVVFSSIVTIPVKIRNARLKLELAIPAGTLITVINDGIDLSKVSEKAI